MSHIISTAVFSKDHEYNGKKTKELSGSLCPLIDSLAGNLLQQHMMELETPSPEWLCKLEQECKSDCYIIAFNPDGVEEDKRAIYEGCYDTAVEILYSSITDSTQKDDFSKEVGDLRWYLDRLLDSVESIEICLDGNLEPAIFKGRIGNRIDKSLLLEETGMAETDDEIIVKILEQDNLVADHAMNEAILDYDRSIQRLNMLLVVSGVMLTIGANLILRDLERHIFILTAIFLCTTLISSAVCILGLFMKRDLKGLLNPNSDSLRKAKDLASFYNSSIDSKISDREIREGNSLQNLYRGGEFDE